MRTFYLATFASLVVFAGGCTSASAPPPVTEPAPETPPAPEPPEALPTVIETPLSAMATAMPTGGIALDRIEGVHRLRRARPLCDELPRFRLGGGVYRVTALRSVEEPSGDAGGPIVPFTYASLELVDAWTPGAIARPVVRMRGGARPDGSVRGAAVSLAVGEQLGILLQPPTSYNRSYPSVSDLGVFRPEPGGALSNGMHVLGTRAEAARTMARTVGAPLETCRAADVPPANRKRVRAPSPDVEVGATRPLGASE